MSDVGGINGDQLIDIFFCRNLRKTAIRGHGIRDVPRYVMPAVDLLLPLNTLMQQSPELPPVPALQVWRPHASPGCDLCIAPGTITCPSSGGNVIHDYRRYIVLCFLQMWSTRRVTVTLATV